MAFFTMTETGMEPIENPSQFFVSERTTDIPGSAVTVLREGTRPILVEIESLVSTSYTPYPSRISEQLRRELLSTLLSILETRSGFTFFNLNVVVKTTGGIQIREQSANLGVMMSIVSSAKNKPISRKTIFLADVGLTGELKRVPAIESRLKEADRMGFTTAFVAEGTKIAASFQQLRVIPVKTIQQVITSVYPTP
jgi:DNA repair protein RadA/Sms